MCQFFREMGYQGCFWEARLQVGIRMEFLLCLATESGHAHNAGGFSVTSDGDY